MLVVAVVELTAVVVTTLVVVAKLVVVAVVVRVVFPDAASAALVPVVSISETTGGVITAKRPHCSRKERRSNFWRSSSDIRKPPRNIVGNYTVKVIYLQ
jgi:hypothetical protein